jgi:hypothetical protein
VRAGHTMAAQPLAWADPLIDALPGLVRLYWALSAGAVIVTILPIPAVPQAFR